MQIQTAGASGLVCHQSSSRSLDNIRDRPTGCPMAQVMVAGDRPDSRMCAAAINPVLTEERPSIHPVLLTVGTNDMGSQATNMGLNRRRGRNRTPTDRLYRGTSDAEAEKLSLIEEKQPLTLVGRRIEATSVKIRVLRAIVEVDIGGLDVDAVSSQLLSVIKNRGELRRSLLAAIAL